MESQSFQYVRARTKRERLTNNSPAAPIFTSWLTLPSERLPNIVSDNTAGVSSSESEPVSGKGTPRLGNGVRLAARITPSRRIRYSWSLVDISSVASCLLLSGNGDKLGLGVLKNPVWVCDDCGVKALPVYDDDPARFVEFRAELEVNADALDPRLTGVDGRRCG